MPEQAKTRDVGAGVNVLLDRFHLLQKHVLAGGHALQRRIQIRGRGGAGHGSCEQHPCAQRATDQQSITGPQARFEPGRFAAAVHCEGDLYPETCRNGCRTARLHRVTTDKFSFLFIQHRADARQGLHEQLLLCVGWNHGQGDRGHGAGGCRPARPKI